MNSSPAYPIAGPAVAAELATLPPDKYPALWEWLGRVAKFKQKLDMK